VVISSCYCFDGTHARFWVTCGRTVRTRILKYTQYPRPSTLLTMSQASEAPLQPAAETSNTVEPSTSLSVDDSPRQHRKEQPSYNFASKSGQWPSQHARYLSPSPAPSGRLPSEPRASFNPPEGRSFPSPRQSFVHKFWARNKGAVLVALSQFFGSLMNLSARLLEFEGEGMHPLQVLLMRQAMTSACCLAYMWWSSTPDAFFGSGSGDFQHCRAIDFVVC
jgi:hypothetical protein